MLNPNPCLPNHPWTIMAAPLSPCQIWVGFTLAKSKFQGLGAAPASWALSRIGPIFPILVQRKALHPAKPRKPRHSQNPALYAVDDRSWEAFVYSLISIFFFKTESTKESQQIIKHPNSGLSLINEEEGAVSQEPWNAGLRLCHNWSLLFPAEVYLSHFLLIVSSPLLIN